MLIVQYKFTVYFLDYFWHRALRRLVEWWDDVATQLQGWFFEVEQAVNATQLMSFWRGGCSRSLSWVAVEGVNLPGPASQHCSGRDVHVQANLGCICKVLCTLVTLATLKRVSFLSPW